MFSILRRQKTQVFEVFAVIEMEDDGTYHGFCPALKGLHTSGRTVEETVDNIKNAAIAYFRSLIKHGDPIPVGPYLKEGSVPSEKAITRNILVSVAA